jgi:hypothetical protein
VRNVIGYLGSLQILLQGDELTVRGCSNLLAPRQENNRILQIRKQVPYGANKEQFEQFYRRTCVSLLSVDPFNIIGVVSVFDPE